MTAENTPIQTTTAEESGTVTGEQVRELALRIDPQCLPKICRRGRVVAFMHRIGSRFEELVQLYFCALRWWIGSNLRPGDRRISNQHQDWRGDGDQPGLHSP